MTEPTLTAEQLGMLRSYAGGPRIWDAAALQVTVFDLEGLGLIEPDDDRGAAYRLTAAGRAVVDANPRAPRSTGGYDRHEYTPDFTRPGDPCDACGFGRNNAVHA